MALGQIGKTNAGWLMNRELKGGLTQRHPVGRGGGHSCLAASWFSDITLGYIFAGAMIINLLTAALAGAYLPMMLKSLKIDPALAGGVALTTITDVVGFHVLSWTGGTIFY